jgi:hypothetical protein
MYALYHFCVLIHFFSLYNNKLHQPPTLLYSIYYYHYVWNYHELQYVLQKRTETRPALRLSLTESQPLPIILVS